MSREVKEGDACDLIREEREDVVVERAKNDLHDLRTKIEK